MVYTITTWLNSLRAVRLTPTPCSVDISRSQVVGVKPTGTPETLDLLSGGTPAPACCESCTNWAASTAASGLTRGGNISSTPVPPLPSAVAALEPSPPPSPPPPPGTLQGAEGGSGSEQGPPPLPPPPPQQQQQEGGSSSTTSSNNGGTAMRILEGTWQGITFYNPGGGGGGAGPAGVVCAEESVDPGGILHQVIRSIRDCVHDRWGPHRLYSAADWRHTAPSEWHIQATFSTALGGRSAVRAMLRPVDAGWRG